MRTLLLAALASAATAAFAQGPNPSEARDGDFGAILVLTDDPKGFWEQWDQPETPQVSTTEKITRERPVETVIVFHDCTPAADGNCNVTVHFEMTRPDGQPYQKPLDGVAWSHSPAPGHNLMPSLASLRFKLDPPDKLGAYVVSAKLTDTVSGKALMLTQTVTAVDQVSPSQPTT